MGEKVEFKCSTCGHDIDNHTYRGCLVQGCRCAKTPHDIAKAYLGEKAK